MPEYRTLLHGRAFGLTCSERLQPMARRVFGYLQELLDRGQSLDDGTVVQFFWVHLTLRGEPDSLRVLAPDLAGDPEVDTDPDLSSALALLLLQLQAAARVGVGPQPIGATDVVHLAPGTLEAEAVMMRRAPATRIGDSGWHLRPDGPLQEYADDYTELPVHRLITARKGLGWPLALPTGLLVRMRGDEVVSVLDTDRRERWGPGAA